MVSIYFIEFYKKIYNILVKNTQITNSAKSLAATYQSDFNRTNQYLDDIGESKWQELGATIFKSDLISGIKKNMSDLLTFINSNLVVACQLAIDPLLEQLIKMKEKDEMLYEKKLALETTRNNLYFAQQNMPSEPYKNKRGVWC